MKTEELIKEVKKNTDLNRYPFDEFWFNIGWNKCEEEFNKKVEEFVRRIIRRCCTPNKPINTFEYAREIKEIIQEEKDEIFGEEKGK